MRKIVTIACTLYCLSVIAGNINSGEQTDPVLLSGHSHNDYEQDRPLWHALENRFISIEADIHLSGGSLLVGHDPEDLKVDRTLQTLYLEPLRTYSHANQYRVYPGHELILLIDIKTGADTTYKVLRKVLSQYADILTRYTAEKVERRAVAVIISGNRPRQLMMDERIRYCTYDGRLADLDQDFPPNFILLISDNWLRHFRWRGEGSLPATELDKLSGMIYQAHTKGARLRFWNLPAEKTATLKNVWATLLSAGVDLLSIDDLKAYHAFIRGEYHDFISEDD